MFERLLESLPRALDTRSIPYMPIGGKAVLLYGEPRLTRDIGITLGLPASRLPLVLEVACALRLHSRVPDRCRCFASAISLSDHAVRVSLSGWFTGSATLAREGDQKTLVCPVP